MILPLPQPPLSRTTLWPCFLCGSEVICSHREGELLVWWLRKMAEERAA